MSKSVEEVVADALALPAPARALIAELLLESLDIEGEDAVEVELSPAWQAEIERRVRAVEEGVAVLVDAEEAFAKARAALR